MNVVIFTHPAFATSKSMMRFTEMLAVGIKNRKHTVEIWAPKSYFSSIPSPKLVKKWLGYIDQFILFPLYVRSRIRFYSHRTLFVFIDNALGPWVPIVADRPHIIHCHDFLAQHSALDKIEDHKTSWTGKKYQAFIRRGYSTGRNFISVSAKTQIDLHKLLVNPPKYSEVLHNALSPVFYQKNKLYETENFIKIIIDHNLFNGYILHVGGNPWYKNRIGVIEIYNSFRLCSNNRLPLVLIGQEPSVSLLEEIAASPFKENIHIVSGIDDQSVRVAYARASVFLFPSLAEGFGWPIAEAMASGCPVVTTNEAPMTEVAGNAAFLIPRRPIAKTEINGWAIEAAKVVNKIISLTPTEREEVINAGLENAKRFDTNSYINTIERIYQEIIDSV